MKVALVQFDTIHNSPQANIATIERLLAQVECDLVVLPEMFSTGYNTNAEAIAEESNGPTKSWMESYAAEHNCGVVGSVAIRERGEYRNRLYVCLPDGTSCHYDKRHLFTFAGEDKSFSAGKERIVVEWKGVRILPLVCYDLRFPAWSYLPGAVARVLASLLTSPKVWRIDGDEVVALDVTDESMTISDGESLTAIRVVVRDAAPQLTQQF